MIRRALEDRLGHRFRDPVLLTAALTHPSASAGDFSRLECLGDALLTGYVTLYLFRSFPQATPRELSRRRASLVSTAALAAAAKQIGLDGALCLGKGEEVSGGRGKPSILAAAFESFTAALYLDGGHAAIERIVGEVLKPERSDPGEDPKSRLQVMLQARGLGIPSYHIREKGDSQQLGGFRATAMLGRRRIGVGEGRSRQEAEQAAALDALGRM